MILGSAAQKNPQRLSGCGATGKRRRASLDDDEQGEKNRRDCLAQRAVTIRSVSYVNDFGISNPLRYSRVRSSSAFLSSTKASFLPSNTRP